MPELPRMKVGIVACSGEELAEGTVTRLAALEVLGRLRPRRTVTICLPLFLAGGEEDRTFARLHPTITVDGCDKRCAERATTMHSGPPAASLVVTELAEELGIGPIEGRRRLNGAGLEAVAATAARISAVVDAILPQARPGPDETTSDPGPPPAGCACGAGLPVSRIPIGGAPVTVAALPLILDRLAQAGRPADEETGRELLELVRIYNSVPAGSEPAWARALLGEYAARIAAKGGPR